MGQRKRSALGHGITDVNITPLADVCTTLILVFIVTMPTLLWNGIQVNATRAQASPDVVVQRPKDDRTELLTVAVLPEGLTLNRQPITLANLPSALERELTDRDEKTVVVVPSDLVPLGEVVTVLDIAKASGAQHLALLDRRGEGRP